MIPIRNSWKISMAKSYRKLTTTTNYFVVTLEVYIEER
jgi:hypothetical protein